MRTSTLLARNLRWYWRTNLAVVLGVATATGVLAGALEVGESVRASLRDLVLNRLGNVHTIVTRDGFFREQLGGVPMIAIEGIVTHEPSRRRANRVEVYGYVGSETLISAALAQELGSQVDDTILLRVEKPSAIPLESLHGRKEDVGKTIRLSMSGIATREFSIRPQQGDLRAIYLPLTRLQRELAQPKRANTLLFEAPLPPLNYTLEDFGLRQRELPDGTTALESESGILSDTVAQTVKGQQILTYLANSMRIGDRSTPYSLVTALNAAPAPADDNSITLNEWAARDLSAKPGDSLTLEYFYWKPTGVLETATAEFRVAQIVPISGLAADRDLAPVYPGITDSDGLHDWDPPFPLDLSRIRPRDEEYWKQYRATPKAFIRLARGQQLWSTRYGKLTSIRMSAPVPVSAFDPAKMGVSVIPIREEGLTAARGATDFGEYFLYFSFFVMVSALLLTGLFFKLGVEQRTREIGVLRALGFSAAKIRNIFLLEGIVLAAAGAIIGVAAALGYGSLILYGLRTWWVDAVGTRLLTLHTSPLMLALGALGGIVTGLGTIAWTLRRVQAATPRSLVTGHVGTARGTGILACVSLLAAAILAFSLRGTAGFFGAGALLLISALLFQSTWLRSRAFAITSQTTLGLRSTTFRPGRSILCIALIASATFLIVSLDAFRRDGSIQHDYPYLAESMLPLIHNPQTTEGREALNLSQLDIIPFRLRPGDDASCLNLYQPRNPRILGAPAGFRQWPPTSDGTIPAVADANSLTYVLHKKVGDELVINNVRFRIVEALHDSIFQSEILISEENFLRIYPDEPGFRFFLLKTAPEDLEEALSDYGFDIQSVESRLASFHRVENTYLSTFRALGGLGLVLGTVGLAAIVLRNVLERRRELALLRAVGYRPRHLAVIVLAENLLLLLLGLATGTVCALLAVAPTAAQRGGQLPIASTAALLAAVLLTGVLASILATAAALRSPLLEALRSE